MSKNEITMETSNVKPLISGGEWETHIKEINMVRNLQAMEDHLHQDIAYSAKPILMTQASAKSLNTRQTTSLNNARSTMHVICVSKRVSTRLTLALRL